MRPSRPFQSKRNWFATIIKSSIRLYRGGGTKGIGTNNRTSVNSQQSIGRGFLNKNTHTEPSAAEEERAKLSGEEK